MPAKTNAKPVTKKSPRDVPRAGYICASYSDGHNVHYEVVMKAVPKLVPEAAMLEFNDGQVTLIVDGERLDVFSHNPVAFWSLIDELGSACDWYSTRNLVCWHQGKHRHWATLSLEPVQDCYSSDEAAKAEREYWENF